MEHYVVVGGGQAGQVVAMTLRNKGFEGKISLFCEEPVPPYQRPPLSKAYLLGEMELDRLLLRPAQFYADHEIDLVLGRPVESIDPRTKTIVAGEEVIDYDKLALTTGSLPRRLPAPIGGSLKGVYTVRTLADVDAMAAEFRPGRQMLVVGGGYIGLEAAAVARKLGLEVTVIEMAERILQRVAAPETSTAVRALHEEHGVVIREKTGLTRLLGDTHVTGAELADGSVMDVDIVVAGIGIMPDIGLAEAAGLAIENGIRVDGFSRSSDPHIWAAGDCASFPYRGGRIRLESVGNAIDQGENAALNMLGHDVAYDAKPWFWSDQYDMKLQIAGLNMGYDKVVERSSEDGSKSFWYYAGDELLAVDAINDARSYMVGKRMIDLGMSPAPEFLADPSINLKKLLKG